MGRNRKGPKKKARQRIQTSWPEVLLNALVDLAIGTVLILIDRLVK